MKIRCAAVITFALVLAVPAAAIIIRHDRDDARYVELGHNLAGICHLNLQHEGAPPDGEGVLITPQWVLTAAHVGVEIRPGHVLTVVGRDITVEVEADTVFLNPQWDDGPHDIALVRLRRRVAGIDPVAIYRHRDEAGKTITVGGIGDFGTGETGPTTNDGKLRAATNIVDEVTDNWLKFRFDNLDRATELEGISGPGDSGGPAFMFDGDSKFVVGVSSGQSTRDSGGREGFYGAREYYTRVSSYCDWIDQVLHGNESPQASGELTEESRRFASRFMNRAFDDVVELYTDQMKAALPRERSLDVVDQLVAQNGAVERIGDPWFEDQVQQYFRYRVPIVFEKATLDMRVVYDSGQKVAGLFFVPHTEPREAQEPPVVGKVHGTETEVTIGGSEKGLPGTLTLPEGSGPFPAAILVHGSGPNDRDETIGPNKPLRDIAWGLAERGIATLRYDKRSFVYPSDLVAIGEALTVSQEVIGDARSGLDFLHDNPSIEHDAVYVIGHSLGGNLAPRIAAAQPRPAGVVILAGSTLPLPEKMLEQQRYICLLDGELSAAERQSLDQLAEEVALIRAGIDETKTVTGFQLGAPIGYYRDLEAVDATALLAKLRIPCLILQGGRDYQVTLEDFAGWQQALSGSPQACLRVFDGLDHLLREGEGPSSPADYDVAAPVSTQLIDCIAKWIHQKKCCSE